MRWLILIALLASVAGCADASSGPAGTRQDPPPGSQQTTAQAVTPAGGISTATLLAAAAQTKIAHTYRGTFSFTTTVTNGAEIKSDAFLVYEAALQGENSQVAYTGGAFNEILGGGVRIEVVNTGKKSYIRGATMFGGADPEKWYVFPDSRMTDLPLDGNDILQMISEDFSRARAGAVVSLDAQTCVLWTSDFRSTASNLLEWLVGRSASGNVHSVENAEARYVACRDGYIHQMEWNLSARNVDDPAERTSIAIRVRQSDFGASTISIQAPQGAIEIR